MEKQIKIGFDIDGVVIDFTASFLATAKNKFDVLHGVTRNSVVCYNYWECLDLSKEKCFEIVDYVLQNPFECYFTPIRVVVGALTLLSNHTDLLLVTARKDNCIKQTKEVVYHVLPDVDKNKIKIVHIKGSQKYKVLKRFGVTHFVDDKLTTCRVLEQHGISTILFKSPWNLTKEPFYRTNCWDEISEFIFENVIEREE